MKKTIVTTVVIIASVLGILAGRNEVIKYIAAKDAAIASERADAKNWAQVALKYQSEAMNLGYELEDLDKSTDWLYEEIEKVKKENESLREKEEVEVGQESLLTTDDYWELKHLIEYQAKELDIVQNALTEVIVVSEPNIPVLVDVIPQVMPGVVHIMCPQWQGSGFVVGPRTIMTARHVNKGVEDYEITTYDGHKIHATRAFSSKKYDLSCIYIDDLTCVLEKAQELECNKVKHKVKLHVLELGSIKDCKLGQQVFVIGSPYGKINFNAVSMGIISGLDRDWDEINPYTGEEYGWSIAFTTDSAGHPGNSGGPVFSMEGKVIGILVGGFSPVLISVIPCDLFMYDIDEINRMFLQDEYQREGVLDVAAEAWNY